MKLVDLKSPLSRVTHFLHIALTNRQQTSPNYWILVNLSVIIKQIENYINRMFPSYIPENNGDHSTSLFNSMISFIYKYMH